MATFDGNVNFDAIIPKNLRNDKSLRDLFAKMLMKSGEILKNEMKNASKKHIYTGRMYNSVNILDPKQKKSRYKKYKDKVYIDENGNLMVYVGFRGSSGIQRLALWRNGMKVGFYNFDRTNWIKAYMIEYGTKDRPPQPFIRPAVERSRQKIDETMRNIFEIEMQKHWRPGD